MKYRRYIALICALWVLLITGGVYGVQTVAHKHNDLPSTVAVSTDSPVTPTPSSQAAATAQSVAKPARGAQLAVRSNNITACSMGSLAQPAAVKLSDAASGVTIHPLVQANYTVYGASPAQISAQMYNCSPVIEGGSRFAASTDYALNWSFVIQGNTTGMCSITDVRIGLAVAQTYPEWQPAVGTPASVSSAWQRFSTNLHTHEDGHANLNLLYVNQLLATLQSIPATDCTTIKEIANTQADALMSRLNQAHEDYDHTTNHGATQGAVL